MIVKYIHLYFNDNDINIIYKYIEKRKSIFNFLNFRIVRLG